MNLKYLKIHLLVLVLLVTIPAISQALTIDNRGKGPALVIVKNAKFETVGKWKISAQSVEDIVFEAEELPAKNVRTKSGRSKRAIVYQLEIYLKDPNDPTGAPTFFHDISAKDTVCVPQNLCPEPKRKKEGGINPFKLW